MLGCQCPLNSSLSFSSGRCARLSLTLSAPCQRMLSLPSLRSNKVNSIASTYSVSTFNLFRSDRGNRSIQTSLDASNSELLMHRSYSRKFNRVPRCASTSPTCTFEWLQSMESVGGNALRDADTSRPYRQTPSRC